MVFIRRCCCQVGRYGFFLTIITREAGYDIGKVSRLSCRCPPIKLREGKPSPKPTVGSLPTARVVMQISLQNTKFRYKLIVHAAPLPACLPTCLPASLFMSPLPVHSICSLFKHKNKKSSNFFCPPNYCFDPSQYPINCILFCE